MDLLKCDKCGNRNIMCCVCEKNKQYRKTDFSHDVYTRNKALDDFVNVCKSNILCQTFGLRQCDIEKIAEQLKTDDKKDLGEYL